MNIALITSIVGGMVQAAAQNPRVPAITAENAGKIERGLVDSVLNSPELINAISAEWPIQSRIVWGAGFTVLIGAGGVIANVMAGNWNPLDYMVPAMTLAGGVAVLRARLKAGLKPLFAPDGFLGRLLGRKA